jgi:kynureninase
MAPLLGALRIHHEAGIGNIWKKSLSLTEYLRDCATALLSEFGITFALSSDMPQGGHVALRHPQAKSLSAALRAAGVIPDFRPPDIIRLAPIPLYTSFEDCLDALRILRDILERGDYASETTGQDLVP